MNRGLDGSGAPRLDRGEVAGLAALSRAATTEGEWEAARWAQGRLAAAGAAKVVTESFPYQGTYAGAHAAHFAAGMLGGTWALAAALSYELEFSGRLQWARRLLPRGTGVNVVARLPSEGPARRTLVLVAHHDAARTGLIWHPRIVRASRGGSYATLPALGFALAATRPTRRAGRALLAALVALQADVARGAAVPGASDNATGVAATLALVRHWAARPLPGCEVIAVLPGCEEAGMGGMAAWMAAEGRRLDPRRTLVLGLDTLGGGDPVLAAREGGLWPVRYREADLAWADRAAARAGLEPPPRVRVGGWTDPVLALLAGLPAISLLSMRDGVFDNYHVPEDTPERVDWDCAERCLRLAAAIGEEWAGVGSDR